MADMQTTPKTVGLDPDVQAITDLDTKLANDSRFSVAVDKDGNREYTGKINGESVQIAITADKANVSLMATQPNGTSYAIAGGPDSLFSTTARDVVAEINKTIEQPQSLPTVPDLDEVRKQEAKPKTQAPPTTGEPLW